jgi:DNA-binding NtrC family response regulator
MPKEKILVVDDEVSIRAYVKNILRIEGFQLLEGVDGVDALQQVQRSTEPVDLLLTDIRMPRMDGIELAYSVTEMFPRTPVVYMSGYPFDLEEVQSRRPLRACAFVAKPFTRRTLLDAVEKCLHPPQSSEQAAGTTR